MSQLPPQTHLEFLTRLLNSVLEKRGKDAPFAKDLREQIAMHEKPRAERITAVVGGGS